jgi:hypothetical protein
MSRFADTSYFLALLIPNDENHSVAVTLATEWRGSLVTKDFVLMEVGNHLSPPKTRGVFAKFLAAISREPRMNIIPASHEWVTRGTELYDSRPVPARTSVLMIDFPPSRYWNYPLCSDTT